MSQDEALKKYPEEVRKQAAELDLECPSVEWVPNSGLPQITLKSGDGVVKLYKFGAHVSSFVHKGKERLWLSNQADLSGATAIRGGVPICFPQFVSAATRAPLKRTNTTENTRKRRTPTPTPTHHQVPPWSN
jgi:D-hexose-6-phosphate mutarotase